MSTGLRWVVVVMGDLTLNADVIGPFRDRAPADRVAERIEKKAAQFMASDGGDHPALVQVVPLVPGSAATRAAIAEILGVDQ